MIKHSYDKEYAVYKNDEIIAMGTAHECGAELGIKAQSVYWMSTPAGKRRLAKRKDINNATTSVLIE